MRISKKSILVISSVWMGFVAALLVIPTSSAINDKPEAQDANSKSTSPVEIPSRPMIIWFHNAPVHKTEILEKALSSGIITHVWVLFLNPQDAPLTKLDKARKAIEVCKRYKVKVIWARTLWPSYEVKNFHRSDMSDPNYYKNFIDEVRMEAKILGADYTAVDTEPYAFFPFKTIKSQPLTAQEYKSIKSAVNQAIGEKGQLDFVAPACGSFPNHIYYPLSLLGKLRVAEHTYYDIPKKRENKNRPYDIFGAYVNVTKHNEGHPSAPFFTPEEILRRQDLWSHKKGLAISANHKNMRQVAEIMSKIRYIRPEHSGSEPNE